MTIQNNPTPLVVLILVVMASCAFTGMLLGKVGPFNSETNAARIQITQTQAARDSFATQSVLEAAQTQQFPVAQQTNIAAEMTVVPLQETATSIAESILIRSAYFQATQTTVAAYSQNGQLLAQATQTALGNALINQQVAVHATATAIAQSQAREQAAGTTKNILVVLGGSAASVWLITSALSKTWAARAQFLAEQRRLAALRVKIQSQKQHRDLRNPIPTSLIEKIPREGRRLPRAE